MRFCRSHARELVNAIDVRGLGHLVARHGDDEDSISVATDPRTRDEWDPLVQAAMIIFQNAYKCAGDQIMAADADGGHRCPICYGAYFDPTVGRWIEIVADACLTYASRHALIDTGPRVLH